MDIALSAAVGPDAELMAELRMAFVESAEKQADLLARARCDANWLMAALRLKGLCASFGAHDLVELADAAIESAPGDPLVQRKIATALAEHRARL